MDKLACFYIWHVKQLQIKQGDLDKKKILFLLERDDSWFASYVCLD